MLASQIASEINQRWPELAHLPNLDRLHILESLIERHVLATGPCCSSTYMPSFEGVSELDPRPDEATRIGTDRPHAK